MARLSDRTMLGGILGGLLGAALGAPVTALLNSAVQRAAAVDFDEFPTSPEGP